MKFTARALLVLLFALLALPAFAQTKGAFHINQGNTPSWFLMTPDERNAHREKMMTMKSEADCKAYMEELIATMSERAKEKNMKLPNTRSVACDDMNARGMFK